MSKDANAVGMKYRRYHGFIFGFVLGVAIACVVMGFLWNLDSARQERGIKDLRAQVAERDATIESLYAQLPAKQEGTPASEKPPSAEKP
jgi:hypothetical protein